jgi:lipopolysaccharide transport system ATP-binding protein
MTRAEVTRRFDEIVDFSGIEKFLDTPVKHYSSGMYVRLAFAVAAHLQAEILIVDEVLAVGDAEFQKRCLGKMRDVAKSGKTVLFVSHNLNAIHNLCSRGIFLNGGRVSYDGTPVDALYAYEMSFSGDGSNVQAIQHEGPLGGVLHLANINILQDGRTVEALNPLRAFEVELVGRSEVSLEHIEFTLNIYRDGLHVASCRETGQCCSIVRGVFRVKFQFPGDLFLGGFYTMAVGAEESTGDWLWSPEAAALKFLHDVSTRNIDHKKGLVRIPFKTSRTYLSEGERRT